MSSIPLEITKDSSRLSKRKGKALFIFSHLSEGLQFLLDYVYGPTIAVQSVKI